MRLLDSESFELRDECGVHNDLGLKEEEPVPFVALSHRRLPNEVTFEDIRTFESLRANPGIKRLSVEKTQRFCHEAV